MTAIQDTRVHAPLVMAEGICFIIVCSLMVALRFYARKISGSSLGLDDWAIASALLFVLGLAITMIVETSMRGFGYATDEGSVGPGHPDANVAGWPTELLQVPALGCIKLSFLLLYRRVFTERVAVRFSIANWFMIFIVCAWTIGYFFVLLFLCNTNFAAYWTSSTTEQTECLPTAPVHLSYAISDVITDVLTIILPIPEIWKLHLPTARKWAVTGVFGLGAITIAMSIIRMVIYQQALSVQFDPDTDYEYITTLTSYFSMLEAGLGLCASCLPVQYGLLRSEKVRSILRSIYSLGSLGRSRGSDAHASQHSLPNPHPTKKVSTTDSQVSEAGGAGSSSHRSGSGHHDDVELGGVRGNNEGGIMVTKDFSTMEHEH